MKIDYKQIQKFWEDNKIFEKSNIKPDQFTFYDGPPFATGEPHYGHLLVGTIKDVVARYKSMNGYSVPRVWGWDCHGVPVESLVQKSLNCSAIDVISNNKVKEFNDACRDSVLLCADKWKDTVKDLGRWVDFDNSYKTMDIHYMESVWWVFKQIFDKNRIYKAKKIMPYSCKLQTTLSNFEVSDSYRNVKDPYAIVKFKAVDRDYSILIYTTTPWTLPTNAAICLNPDIDYSVVKLDDSKYLVASDLISKVFAQKEISIVETAKGSEFKVNYYSLDGTKVNPVVFDSYVLSTSGTGAVHISPLFGEDDYRVGKTNNLEMLDLLDQEGKFISGPYAGIFCKDADNLIIEDLKQQGKIYKHGIIYHDYPFCDRTNMPLIYRAVDAWYLKVEDLKDKLVENNSTINWYPEAIGANRFNNWLLQAKDWNISRNRIWGSCIPIWQSEDGETICVGSIKELEDLSGQKVYDLHKDTLDNITFTYNNKFFKRVPEVLDCWFESGSMPYAQHHYPFENKELVEKSFPADFIVEGLDQTRGWFYTLLVISTILFDKAPFKNVMVNGLVLSSDGTKMSKSKNNYTPVSELLDKYGADALRLYLCSSSVIAAEPLQFSEIDLETVSGKVINPLLSALDFYKLYKGIDNWQPGAMLGLREIDYWLLAKLDDLVKETRLSFDKYELSKPILKVQQFLDDLCNWYIRSSRSVFWQNEMDSIKQGAYHTLHYTLYSLAKLLAPYSPFLAEHVFHNLGYESSVHLEGFPAASSLSYGSHMDDVRLVVKMAHNLRVKSNIKVKQPLSELSVYGTDFSNQELSLIKNETNVKRVFISKSSFVKKEVISYKANFKTLGKKCGIKVNDVAKLIKQLHDPVFPVCIDGFNISKDDVIETKSVVSDLSFESKNNITVVLDTNISPSLLEEGVVREVCSFLQSVRKDKKMLATDKITLKYSCGDFDLVDKYSDLIKTRLLVSRFEKAECSEYFIDTPFGKVYFDVVKN